MRFLTQANRTDLIQIGFIWARLPSIPKGPKPYTCFVKFHNFFSACIENKKRRISPAFFLKHDTPYLIFSPLCSADFLQPILQIGCKL
ncbi:MAG: hypothetical protein O3C32_07760, partial [Bacteroidetes bacterium]|nr:hypothetical protein [Bacteroidota bacterium]